MKQVVTIAAGLLLLLSAPQGIKAQDRPSGTQAAAASKSSKPYTVSGTAIDASTGQPVSYATATLAVDSTTLPVAAVVTDGDGRFTLATKAAGSYVLHISFTGYTAASREIALNETAPSLKLGEIQLDPGLTTEEVTVTAQRPLVTADIDKITYNATSDPETPTLTALEMMRKVPMLTVDGDDNLQLKGQTNFKILVNGKTSTLMAKNYKEVLKAMPAGSIKSIEVITDPPAKYDAEGIGGIINIITNRKTNNGFNGSVGLGADTWGGVNGNAYIAAALGKFSLSANYFGGYFRQPEGTGDGRTETFNSLDARYLDYTRIQKGNGVNNGLSLEMGYEIDTFNLLSLSLNGYLANFDMTGDMHTGTFDPDRRPTTAYDNRTFTRMNFGSVTGNIDYQRTFRKPDRTFTVSYKLDYNPNTSKYDRDITGTLNYPTYSQRSDNKAAGYEHTFQADYFDPITKVHQIEAGVKYILRPNTSNTEDYRRDHGGEWTPDDSQKNDLDYRQHIAAAYASYLMKLSKFSVKLGARAEYTVNDGTFKLRDGDHKLDNKYFDLIPYVTLGWQPDQMQTLKLGYTQRLSRPGIWYLNPYVNDLDPSNVETGNPRLESEISHNFDLSYSNFGKIYNISVSLNTRLTNNAIERVTTTTDNGGLFSTYDNIGQSRYYGLYFYGALRLLENKLSFSLNAGAGYTTLNANDGSGLKNHGWSGNGHLNINVQPWKNGNIYVGGGFWSGGVGLQSKSPTGWYHSIGISQGFLDKKLRLGVSVSNPFRGKLSYGWGSFGPDFEQQSHLYQPVRSLRVNLTWNFGKMQAQVKKARRGIRNDDVKSGGSSQPGGGAGGSGMTQ